MIKLVWNRIFVIISFIFTYFTDFGLVYSVKKYGGPDDGMVYALKAMRIPNIRKLNRYHGTYIELEASPAFNSFAYGKIIIIIDCLTSL